MTENSTQRERTTIGIWRTTVGLLDRIRDVHTRTRQEQLHHWAEQEARELGIGTEVAKDGEPT